MNAAALRLELPTLPPESECLRQDVRAFIAEERASGHLPPPSCIGLGFYADTTRPIAERGWIGISWPERYGGIARTGLPTDRSGRFCSSSAPKTSGSNICPGLPQERRFSASA